MYPCVLFAKRVVLVGEYLFDLADCCFLDMLFYVLDVVLFNLFYRVDADYAEVPLLERENFMFVRSRRRC